MKRSRSNDEGPVSLFSFQDIITSITGIMILVVMMLVLQVINRKSAEPSSERPQVSDLPDAQQIADLEAEKERLSALVGRQAAAVAKVLPYDSQQLKADMSREEDRTPVLNREITDLTARLAKLKQAMGSALSDTVQDRREVEQLTAQLARLQTANRVTFEFTPSPKTPVLVQCSQSGIQAMVPGVKSAVHTFVPSQGAPVEGAIDQFGKWVSGLDTNKNAFVVLVKPSSAPYASNVIDLLRMKSFDVGYEPLEENKTAVFARESGSE